MSKIDDYITRKSKKKYFCLVCFRFARRKYNLQILEDEKGKAYRCPHCGHMWADWVLEKSFDEDEQRIYREMKLPL